LKKRQKELLHTVFGLVLMILGLIVIVDSFVNLLLRNYQFDTNEIAVGFLVPILLIVIGYNIFRGKDIAVPKFL
jgi:hypothetical protein